MVLRLYNSLTKRLEDFTPADPAHVTFYSCGPTVYDDAHIGNFRSFLAADLLRRFIESPLCTLRTREGGTHAGPRTVTHVMNITDVGHMTDDAEGGEAGEDRMAVAGRRIAEAKKSGKLPPDVQIDPSDPYQIARFYEARFREDARALGLKVSLDAEKDPTLHPKATENIEGMKAVIERLIAGGYAYAAGPAGARAIYFRVTRFGPYGQLSGNTLDKLREGQGGRVAAQNQEQKEHPADFLLWKEDARHVMKWLSPRVPGVEMGPGYPGWHIECTVMSLRARMSAEAAKQAGSEAGVRSLGSLTLPNGNALIDLHSGGEDNIFPHHECEIAQSCCAFNATPDQGTFASMWFHPRFLLVEGTKMSKSKGNFYTARDLFAKGIEPAAMRLELIKTHYRSQANFTMQGLIDSQKRIERWRRVAKWLLENADEEVSVVTVSGRALDQPEPPLTSGTPYSWAIDAARRRAEFSEAMLTDLNAPWAISVLDELADRDRTSQSSERLSLPETPMSAAEAVSMYDDGDRNGTYRKIYALFHLIDAVLGVVFVPTRASTHTDIGVYAPGVTPSPEVESLLQGRRDARAAKDFKKSDAIRDQLAAMGYAIKDMPGGKVEVRRA